MDFRAFVGALPLNGQEKVGSLAATGFGVLPFGGLRAGINAYQLRMAGVQLAGVKTRVRRQHRLRLLVPVTQDTAGRNDVPC